MFGMCNKGHKQLQAKQTLSDLIGERPSSFIINFQQVIKSFLV